MALVIILVNVLEVRIQRVVVEVEIGVGIGRAPPGIGDGEILCVEDFRFGPRIFGDGERPVVSVVADGADDLFLGNDFENAGQVG